MLVRYTYDAWGKIVTTQTENARYSLMNLRTIYRYRGYIYDSETGLYYLQSRYYDSEVGRFINADGYVSTGTGILGDNMYAYCNNNSVMRVDYSGECNGYPDNPNLDSPFSGVRYGVNCGSYGVHVRHPRTATNSTTTSPATTNQCPAKNEDGSYSLYDNRRHQPDNFYHEQILVITPSTPSIDLTSGDAKFGGGLDCDLVTSGYEFDNIDISLLDFGHAEIVGQFKDQKLSVGALASVWSPSIEFSCWDISVGLSFEVAAVGGSIDGSLSGFSIVGAYGAGVGLSVNW